MITWEDTEQSTVENIIYIHDRMDRPQNTVESTYIHDKMDRPQSPVESTYMTRWTHDHRAL